MEAKEQVIFNKGRYSKELKWLNSDFKIEIEHEYISKYLLTQWENSGATYGIELIVDFLNASFILQTYEDSGYSNGHIITTGRIEDISRITIGFKPTIEKDNGR